MKRRKITKRGSKRLFRKTADRTKSINLKPDVMRGGIRM